MEERGVTDELFARLLEQLGARVIVELPSLVGFANMTTPKATKSSKAANTGERLRLQVACRSVRSSVSQDTR